MKPKKGDLIRLRFWEHSFNEEWVTEENIIGKTWLDPDTSKKMVALPIVIQYGWVLEWNAIRVVLKTTKSSDSAEMAWYIITKSVIDWKILKRA